MIPAREQRLAMAVLGIPGSGKTVTLLRRVWIAARAGMRVVFVDCKGTDPGLAWQVTGLQEHPPALDSDQPPALHLLAGRWIASCPVCGFELASATSQARCERRSRHRTCPVCHQVA